MFKNMVTLLAHVRTHVGHVGSLLYVGRHCITVHACAFIKLVLYLNLMELKTPRKPSTCAEWNKCCLASCVPHAHMAPGANFEPKRPWPSDPVQTAKRKEGCSSTSHLSCSLAFRTFITGTQTDRCKPCITWTSAGRISSLLAVRDQDT